MGRMQKELGLLENMGCPWNKLTDSMTPGSSVELPAVVDLDKDSEFWHPVSWGMRVFSKFHSLHVAYERKEDLEMTLIL